MLLWLRNKKTYIHTYARVRLHNGGERTVTLRDIVPVSEKQHYANDNFPSERQTNRENEIQNQSEVNSPPAPSLEDQHNIDSLRIERENLQKEFELPRSAIGGHWIA